MSPTLRVACSAALFAMAAPSAWAQPAPRPAASASAALAPSPATPAVGYRSAFDGYSTFRDEPVRPWRDVNDQVGRIGGWRTYAREAQGGTGPAADGGHTGHGSGTPVPATAARPPTSSASSVAPTGGHTGHRP